ncbi:tyrosine-type recombinase/integrase [Kocuria soli]|uniref:tyrosine-type recombinase/integrase n=1 Tax=Kocuria soli TaxID=2485125 RepID=UPI002277A4E2|nr:tyrosine-type recombinase/integrase [Kocuria soli]
MRRPGGRPRPKGNDPARSAAGGGSELSAPKAESERVVYLPPALVNMLREHIETYGVERDLFWAAGRKLMTGSTADFRWRQARQRAGVECKIHDLRYFYASGLIAAGCDVVTVQRALGHSSATVTLNYYAHLWPSAEDKTREAAATLMQVAS